MSDARPPFKKGSPHARTAGKKGGEVTAVQRRATKAPWRGTIMDLMDAAGMVGQDWTPWRAFWKSVYALSMTPDELEIFRKHTKRETPPSAPVDEAWMEIGRGAGKTRNAALHAVFRAITFDSSTVSAGESITIPLLASDRDQAGAALKYVRGFNTLPVVAPYVNRGDLSQKAEYKTGVDISITTASFKAPRGRTAPTACCDEIAFWSDEGANPDAETLLAVRGTLGRTVGSVLLVLSNPYAPRGELHKAHESYFGKDAESRDDGVLVWNASTLAMRPSHPLRPIKRLWKADPVKAASEYGTEDGFVQFRQGDAALFDEAPVRAAIQVGRRELPPVSGVTYTAFLDMAEGARSGDSAALSIAHNEKGRAVQDVSLEIKPTFSPGRVIVSDFAPVLRRYGIREVRGDNHARGWVEAALDAEGFKFVTSELSKSELYLELLQLTNSGLVELLDDATLRRQLLGLERYSVRSGHDSVDHPRGGRDDVANVCAGALCNVAGVGITKKPQLLLSGSNPAQAGGKTAMREQLAALARSTLARLESQDRWDAAIEKLYENEPMIGTATWHVHRRQ